MKPFRAYIFRILQGHFKYFPNLRSHFRHVPNPPGLPTMKKKSPVYSFTNAACLPSLFWPFFDAPISPLINSEAVIFWLYHGPQWICSKNYQCHFYRTRLSTHVLTCIILESNCSHPLIFVLGFLNQKWCDVVEGICGWSSERDDDLHSREVISHNMEAVFERTLTTSRARCIHSIG